MASRIEGTTWRLAALAGPDEVPVPDDVMATLHLADGSATGSTGVNRYTGAYRLGAYDGLTVGEVAVTLMAGPPEAAAVERAFLAALAATRRAVVGADGGLELLDVRGARLAALTPTATG